MLNESLIRTLTVSFMTAISILSPITCFAVAPTKLWIEQDATRIYFNRPAGLPWNNALGDWRDADNLAQGSRPYASLRIADTDNSRSVSWDITVMVREWVAGWHPNNGVMLRNRPGTGGVVGIYSREAADKKVHPRLLIDTPDGPLIFLPAVADTSLNPTTLSALGNRDVLKTGGNATILFRFDTSRLRRDTIILRAKLQLWTTNRQYGSTTVDAFRVDIQAGPSAPRRGGIALRYPGDRGIDHDPDVIFASNFESILWKQGWEDDSPHRRNHRTIRAARTLKFEPLVGKALQVEIPKGGKTGLNLLYRFKARLGREPEGIYFRYHLRFADDWNPTIDGGKLPGIAGTYGKAGWGGRRANGFNGWSMRGLFHPRIRGDNPFAQRTPIGTYAYHGAMSGSYGEHWLWSRGALGVLTNNRWYAIEQFVKLNTPGRPDGILRVWIDGRLALERRNIQYRNTADLKIDRIWMNVYHGGTSAAPTPLHLFIDNVVIAKKYIGPTAPVSRRR